MLRLSVLLLLTSLWRSLLSAATPESSVFLPAPQNLTITSYNFRNTLRWSPVNGINGTVSYNVEFCWDTEQHCKKTNCTNTTKPECDFDNKHFHTVILRVRAQQGKLKSAWTKTASFQPKRDTVLGPPRSITIVTEPGLLVVRFLPPFDHTSNFTAFGYSIDYWDSSTHEIMTKYTDDLEYSFTDLKERTEYCFQIKAILVQDKRPGQKSDRHCKQTATSVATTIISVTLIFGCVIFIYVAIFLCLIVIRKYRSKIKIFWQAPLTIPSHYEEDLKNSEMIMDEELQNCAGEDTWDTLSVITNAEQSQTLTASLMKINK
ncbi:interferon gamma receptor 2 [Varanus komodoensis]|uniref:Tissue factor n=1 Tax=Varanus komodoensis TaxID=61221 RepID=A0A8D2J7H7_VARKO|nr:interferon gamma receptor 2 [Varanus komodoensis]